MFKRDWLAMPAFEPIENPRGDVTREKTLWDAVRQSWLVVGKTSDLNIPVWSAVAALFLGFAFDQSCRCIGSFEDVAAALNGWAAIMAQVTSSILGFLIAGFAIFASFPRRSLFWKLASFRREDRSISEFKFIMFNFLSTFLVYLLVLSIDLFSIFATDKVSPLIWILKWSEERTLASPDYIMYAYAVTFVAANFYAILVLRGFIWNLYQAILISIFGEKPQPDPPASV